jgi:hypothetical protein
MVAKCLITLACVLFVAAPSADARKKRDPCRPGHATTEFDNGTFRIFSVPAPDQQDAEYLCVWKSRKRFKLAEGSGGDASGDYLNGFVTAGKFLLYATAPNGKIDLGRGEIKMLDFRSGKRSRPAFGAWPVDWELSRKGTIAYTTDESQGAPRGVYELPLGAAGPDQLDLGEDIDPMSLALAGHTLYWTRAGQAQSAQIP